MSRNPAPPLVSVVVPTYRRPALLSRCLSALLQQSVAPEQIEILVVDDGHDDATAQAVQACARSFPTHRVHYLRPGVGRGPAVARNCGWRAARAPLVAFTDDDTIPAPDWLAAGLQTMAQAPWAACGGSVVVPALSDDPAAAPSDHERMTQGLATAAFVTANAFVRRSALARVGGFDERFLRAWREDSDLQFRLQRDAGEVGRCDAAVVVHPVRAEPWGVSLRQQRNVYFDALLYRKHPQRYRAEIRRTPPWDYHAIVLLSAGAVVLALAGRAAAALTCLALGLLLVGLFARRRLRGTSHAPAHVLEMLVTSALIPFISLYWRVRGAWHFRVWFT